MNQREKKQVIRNKMCSARLALTTTSKEKAAKTLCQQIIKLPIFKQAKHIAFYWPHQAEINTLPLLAKAISLRKYCYLPILHPKTEENALLFMLYDTNTVLKLNKYGIPEPDYKHNYDNAIAIDQISIIFIPLVAFDLHGNRLGMSKGYYDTTLAKMQECPQRPTYIGLGYAMQEVEILPQESWDIKLDGIVTEQGYKIFNTEKFNSLCHNK